MSESHEEIMKRARQVRDDAAALEKAQSTAMKLCVEACQRIERDFADGRFDGVTVGAIEDAVIAARKLEAVYSSPTESPDEHECVDGRCYDSNLGQTGCDVEELARCLGERAAMEAVGGEYAQALNDIARLSSELEMCNHDRRSQYEQCKLLAGELEAERAL